MHRTTVAECSGTFGHGECGGTRAECSCGWSAEYATERFAREVAETHARVETAFDADNASDGYAFDDDDRCDNCGEYDAVAFPIYGRTYTDRWVSAVVGSVRYCESCARVAGLRY